MSSCSSVIRHSVQVVWPWKRHPAWKEHAPVISIGSVLGHLAQHSTGADPGFGKGGLSGVWGDGSSPVGFRHSAGPLHRQLSLKKQTRGVNISHCVCSIVSRQCRRHHPMWLTAVVFQLPASVFTNWRHTATVIVTHGSRNSTNVLIFTMKTLNCSKQRFVCLMKVSRL